MTLLGKSNVNAISLEYKKSENAIEKVAVINSRELIRCIKSNEKLSTLFNIDKKKVARLEEIDKKIALTNLTRAISILDIKDVACTEPEIGSAIVQQIYYNLIQEYEKHHPEENAAEMLNNGNMPTETQKKLLESDEYNDVLIQAIKSNCKYLDLDKLLLSAAFRYIEILEKGHEADIQAVLNSDSNNEQTLTQMQMIKILLSLIESEIKKEVRVECVSSYVEGKIEYSVDNLREDLERFNGDRYKNQIVQVQNKN